MNEFALARVIHVLAVVLWIGGVAMVTTVLIPIIRTTPSDANAVEMFERFEKRFAWQAKFMILIAGGSGFYMLDSIDAWNRYSEPLFLNRLFKKHARTNPEKTFVFVHGFHMVLLTLSLVTIAGAVAGSHGWFPI